MDGERSPSGILLESGYPPIFLTGNSLKVLASGMIAIWSGQGWDTRDRSGTRQKSCSLMVLVVN